MSVRVITGNCAKILPTLAAGSVDAIVTDPPAGISFMGKMWDKPGVLGVSGGRAMPSTTSSRNPSCRGCGGRRRAGPKTKACACAAPDWNDLAYRLKDRAAFIGFMSSAMAEGLRVLKPGGYAFVWALPRTAHWTATALEDAGFEIRDVIVHVFGTGFPKSQAQLKPAAEHWILCRKPGPLRPLRIDACRVATGDNLNGGAYAKNGSGRHDGTENWRFQAGGAGSYKQPAGRWPANFVMSHAPGCAPAGTRTVSSSGHHPARRGAAGLWSGEGGGLNGTERPERHMGTGGTEEVPAYRCAPGCPVALLDAQSGVRKSGGYLPEGGQRSHVATYGRPSKHGAPAFGASEGTASRFFHCFEADPFVYQAKASRAERERGLEDFKKQPGGVANQSGRGYKTKCGQCGGYIARSDGAKPCRCAVPQEVYFRPMVANTHPTVKSRALMRHLVGLVAGPGDLVLDPFLGSGTTAVVCAEEGIACLGIEQDAASVKIARARIRAAERACAALPAAAPAPTPPATPRRAAAPRRTRCAS